MIGIYKITNKITGHFYIGQSKCVERRFMEHKCPKHKCNDRLSADMDKYGVENFVFELIEECKESDLSRLELAYIKKLLPYYNTIGKPMSDETKAKLRAATKAQWCRMSDEDKRGLELITSLGPGSAIQSAPPQEKNFGKLI